MTRALLPAPAMARAKGGAGGLAGEVGAVGADGFQDQHGSRGLFLKRALPEPFRFRLREHQGQALGTFFGGLVQWTYGHKHKVVTGRNNAALIQKAPRASRKENVR